MDQNKEICYHRHRNVADLQCFVHIGRPVPLTPQLLTQHTVCSQDTTRNVMNSTYHSQSRTIRYDTIEEFIVDQKDEWGQLNLAHVARNKKHTMNEKIRTNKRQCPLSSVQVEDP